MPPVVPHRCRTLPRNPPLSPGRREAALCFVWAQTFVTDEIKRRDKLVHLTFVDFLEAIARLCTFKALPTPELIEAIGAHSCAAYFEKAKELATTIDGIDESFVLPALDRAGSGRVEALLSKMLTATAWKVTA